jgi:hypothetical protein
MHLMFASWNLVCPHHLNYFYPSDLESIVKKLFLGASTPSNFQRQPTHVHIACISINLADVSSLHWNCASVTPSIAELKRQHRNMLLPSVALWFQNKLPLRTVTPRLLQLLSSSNDAAYYSCTLSYKYGNNLSLHGVVTGPATWLLVDWPARWEPQEEGVMNIAARFFLS